MSRLIVQKTLKLYVGGEFIRSESGRTLKVESATGGTVHISRASRKDLRDTLEKMRTVQPGWANRTAYNRGQILYRIAEILEDRGESLPTSAVDRQAAVDRAVHHAGWTDKLGSILSSVNPVATSSFVNWSALGPIGIVVAIPHGDDGLLGLVEATATAIGSGNSVVLLVASKQAELAIAYAEALATSDVPAGVVNILSGDLAELIGAANSFDDLDLLTWTKEAISPDLITTAQVAGARVLRRFAELERAEQPASPHQLVKFCEMKTVWMSR